MPEEENNTLWTLPVINPCKGLLNTIQYKQKLEAASKGKEHIELKQSGTYHNKMASNCSTLSYETPEDPE